MTTQPRSDHSTGDGAAPLPAGFAIAVDPGTRQLDGTTLFGGSPPRVLRLTPAGRNSWDDLRAGPVRTRTSGSLARRLTDAGLAHPRPPVPADAGDVTVVIPVRDRGELLERCLTSLGTGHRIVVVDDGSADPSSIAAIGARHGATVISRPVNGGPAAARNDGLEVVDSEFVAFLDSDCVPPPDLITQLVAHLADPLVGAVAPRITALPSSTPAGRYNAARGSLDLGRREARVVPMTTVAYVPTAALLVRTSALREIGAFDTSLRYGEDVDLVWRLHAAGWRVRYDPSIVVEHLEPETWAALLGRRFRYGTSAAALARRHPDSIAPLVLHRWPVAIVAAVLAARPRAAAATFAVATLANARRFRDAGLPAREAPALVAKAVYGTWFGTGRYLAQFAVPLALSRRARLLLLAPPLAAWLTRRPQLDLVRFVAGHLADDIAYGAGVYSGCLRERTSRPLRPHLVRLSKGSA